MDKNGFIKDAARIMKKVQNKAVNATLATLKETAVRMIEDVGKYWKPQFLGVTGNAYTSVSAGVYYKGRLVFVANSGDYHDEPTRPSLKEGERYNLPEYYDGDEVTDEYKGSHGKGGQWGPTLGPWYMRRQHFAKRKTWMILIAIPVSYAEFNPELVKTLQAMMDALPNEVNYNIVSVQNAPSQSVLPF